MPGRVREKGSACHDVVWCHCRRPVRLARLGVLIPVPFEGKTLPVASGVGFCGARAALKECAGRRWRAVDVVVHGG